MLAARVFEEGPFAVFEVTGESFLWNMVRCMATALKRVGNGKIDRGAIALLLACPAGEGLPAAPPEGLILWDVEYGFPFTPLPADERSRRYPVGRHRYHMLMAELSARLVPGEGPPG
ncbi:MAG TPA: hypothetical protein PLV90_09460 [Methanoculleus sp.]|nr:hypothetical protein [Methanoculleus sp.]